MKELKILYLEDSPYDAELAIRILNKAGMVFDLKLVDTKEEFAEALGEYTPDVILSDHSLYQFNSYEALKLFKATGVRIPFILVTGTVSEEFAVNILNEGADDYLLKSNLTRLPSAITNAIEKYKFARERQQYINNIIANESLMKAAEEMARFGSWQYESTHQSMLWSEGAFRILGYGPDDVDPGHAIVLSHMHAADKLKYEEEIIHQTPDKPGFSGELRMFDKEGILKYVFFQVISSFDADGNNVNQLGFMQDVTEKRLLESELARQALARQKLVMGTTIQAQERERKFLGQELHDNINQILTGCKIYLRLATLTTEPEKKTELINKSLEHINQAVGEIRKLSKSLVAPTLGDIGLEVALRDLADEINLAQQLNVLVINESEEAWKIDEQMELMFYRIAQEQLNNIRKYANASEAVILLSSDDTHNYFSISDNGIGFDANERPKGIGLRNISTRVSFYSGEMKVITAPGQGCTIEIKIPKEQLQARVQG